MIKYLGSKRLLVPHIVRVAEVSGCKTGLDLFAGTTRVAQGLKKAGMSITANDLATYSRVFFLIVILQLTNVLLTLKIWGW